ncbi:sensor histidine kinase [Dyadobacter soli]|nr:ATP-binding protein [Dyadobacter soli]
MKSSYRNRIALNFTLGTGLLVALIFLLIYYIVSATVFNRLEKDLGYELDKHFYEVGVRQGQPYFADKAEWLEREHSELEINPVFVVLTNLSGNVIDKSPNLKNDSLKLHFSSADQAVFKTTLRGLTIAQVQLTIQANNRPAGYIVVAMPIDESEGVLFNLKVVLLIAFPAVLAILFVFTRYIAGRSIQPVLTVIETASKISNDNMESRIPVPAVRDELHLLVTTLNELMTRVEHAIEREKRFTADASHELRTPLAVIKGTLEVLIRKPRSADEYVEKISYCITEMDRINHLVDQLLLLTRFESQQEAMDMRAVDLSELTGNVLARHQQQIVEKNLSVDLETDGSHFVYSDPYMTDIMLDNIISNAVKYSPGPAGMTIRIETSGEKTCYTVSDQGIGIDPDDISRIRDAFYRSAPLSHPEVKGSGLGLSIVSRMCEMLGVDFNIHSQLGKGTRVTLSFPILR